MDNLKWGGKVVKAQTTTSKWVQIPIEYQFRWHMMVESKLKELQIVNLPRYEFGNVYPHLQFKIDEVYFICIGGVLVIVSYKSSIHNNNNMAGGVFPTILVRV